MIFPARILISYWYCKKIDVKAMLDRLREAAGPGGLDVFADSGAFTAWTTGVTITPYEYAEWLEKYKDLFSIYLTLDVIGEQSGTDENLRILEGLGFDPLPVLTFQRGGSNYKRLEEMIERYPFIALGGMVPFMGSPKRIMPHIIKCFKMAGDKTVYHGLGCTNWTINKSVPWFSVDSSSWASSFRYGSLHVFDDRTGKWYGFNLGRKEEYFGHGDLFARYGYDVKQFAFRELNTLQALADLSARSAMRAERWLQKRHGIVRIPTRNETGMRCYLVDAAPSNLEIVANAAKTENGLRHYLADTEIIHCRRNQT